MLWFTRVQSHSMAPALPAGTLALTRRLRRRGQVRRRDVIVVASAELGRDIVKRVIGLPGESVDIVAGRVSIDGRELVEPYASASVFTGSYVVPAGHYFLLGDNRDASSDSRTWLQPFVAWDAFRGRIEGLKVKVGRPFIRAQ